MPSFVRAWYVFVALALLTFALTAFVGRVPSSLSAAVALPQAALYRAGVHLRDSASSMVERRTLRAEVEALEGAGLTRSMAVRAVAGKLGRSEKSLWNWLGMIEGVRAADR
ncbi:MAG: hypothetical protein P1P87_14465, partial [Trueperaceae bacterium]|nr:hypothetical protein [Trueperaceae bacterium]